MGFQSEKCFGARTEIRTPVLRICSPAHSHSDIRAVFTPSGKTYFNAPLPRTEDGLNPVQDGLNL